MSNFEWRHVHVWAQLSLQKLLFTLLRSHCDLGRSNAWLSSGWACTAAFTSVAWTRLQSESWHHHHFRCVIHLSYSQKTDDVQWNELCSALYHSSAVLTSMTWTRPQSESWHHHHFRCVCHIPRRQMMCSRMSWSKAKCGSCPSQNGPRMVPGWSSANMNNPVPSLKTFVCVNHETVPLSLETVYRQQYRTTALCWVVGEWGE